MEEILSDFTDKVNSFMNWVGSTEPYGEYWIVLNIAAPLFMWAVVAWIVLSTKGSSRTVIRVGAKLLWWLWLLASCVVIGYLVVWLFYLVATMMFWIDASNGRMYGWGHNWSLPVWLLSVVASIILVAIVAGLERRDRPALAGLRIFWWYGASADLSPDDDTLTDLPAVKRV